MPFPGLKIADEELLLRGIWPGYHRRSALGIAFGKRLPRPLQSAVDRGSRAAEQRRGFGGGPTEHNAQQQRRALAPRELSDGGRQNQLQAPRGPLRAPPSA